MTSRNHPKVSLWASHALGDSLHVQPKQIGTVLPIVEWLLLTTRPPTWGLHPSATSEAIKLAASANALIDGSSLA